MQYNVIFFQAHTQYENTGDLIINRSLVDLLRSHGKLIVNDRGVPDWYLTQLGLQERERLSKVAKCSFFITIACTLLKHILNKNSNVYLVSGLGHFYGYSVFKSVNIAVASLAFALFRGLGCQIIKIGTSLGPLGLLVGAAESFRALFIKHYLVRDSLSLELAKKIGIRHAYFFPDLAWSYEQQHGLLTQPSRIAREALFISFRSSTHELIKEPHYKECVLNALKIIIGVLGRRKIKVGYQVERDRAFCFELFDSLRDIDDLEFIESRIDVDNAFDVYNDVKYVISNRLHVLLYAYKFGALPMALINMNEHIKITGIFKDAYLDDLLLDLTKNNIEIEEKTREIVTQEAVLRQRLNDIERYYIDKSKEILKGIFCK